jgi:hypothetical protein
MPVPEAALRGAVAGDLPLVVGHERRERDAQIM